MKISSFSATVLLVMSVFACDGDSGDPCQVQSDCNAGFICCATGSLGARGICAASCTDIRQDAATDAASTEDASGDARMSDGSQDASSEASINPLPDATIDAQITVDSAVSVDAAADAELDAVVPDAAP